ncbi:MAG: hypothetical protein WC428_02665 [Candidatus Paceibacterota bacterium]
MRRILWDGVWYKVGETIIYGGCEWIIEFIEFDDHAEIRFKNGTAETIIYGKVDIQD